jgi:hypothetical protein
MVNVRKLKSNIDLGAVIRAMGECRGGCVFDSAGHGRIGLQSFIQLCDGGELVQELKFKDAIRIA